MPLDPDLQRMFRQTIYVAQPRGDNTLEGDLVYGSPAAVVCRCEPSTVVTDTSPTGEETVSEWLILTATAIGNRDHIWLPGASVTAANARMPQRVDEVTDEDGSVSHYEVLV